MLAPLFKNRTFTPPLVDLCIVNGLAMQTTKHIKRKLLIFYSNSHCYEYTRYVKIMSNYKGKSCRIKDNTCQKKLSNLQNIYKSCITVSVKIILKLRSL